ncbi:MAG: HEPN domain-containing protein [Chloroflexi bacterium]|nr:HEPN domain-containing protein [Chloroflexota bacterium]
MQLADEALGDAEYLLAGSRYKAAANRAYYAMYHAVHAALAIAGAGRSKTHKGAIGLFGRYYVKTGRIGRAFVKDLRDAYVLRQQTDYEIYAAAGEEPVRETVWKAEAFVAEVKRALAHE